MEAALGGGASAASAGEACAGEGVLGSGRSASEGARATETCARALGAALATRHEYDEAKAREECDSIANARVKRACARAAREEVARRDIDDDAEIPFCVSALKTPVGQATPSVNPPPPPPPRGPVNRDQAEHRKEALRRHGTAVGGALWWACFLSLVVLIVSVSAYVYWRDGGGLGSLSPRPSAQQYSRVGVASTELGAL